MALVRLAYLGNLPSFATLLKQVENAPAAVPPVAAPIVPVLPPALQPDPRSWPEVVALVRHAQPGLAATLEQQVRCEAVGDRVIDVRITGGLHEPDEIIRTLRAAIETATGHPWHVVLVAGDNGAPLPPTIAEEARAKHAAKLQEVAADPSVAAALAMFPGATVSAVEERGVYGEE
jgi:DNA polymerase-3 subunit gamma/tau